MFAEHRTNGLIGKEIIDVHEFSISAAFRTGHFHRIFQSTGSAVHHGGSAESSRLIIRGGLADRNRIRTRETLLKRFIQPLVEPALVHGQTVDLVLSSSMDHFDSYPPTPTAAVGNDTDTFCLYRVKD